MFYVKTLTGKTLTISGLSLSSTCEELKLAIQSKEGIPSSLKTECYNSSKLLVTVFIDILS